MSTKTRTKMMAFGDKDPYVAVITRAHTPCRNLGAIIWGTGIGEMRAAKTASKLGIAAMQIRQEVFSYPQLDVYGVHAGRQAMDELGNVAGIDRFVLMGNCGFGSVAFNIALADPRVVGLAISNPHVSEFLSLGVSYRRRLLSIESWRRLVTGNADLKVHLSNTRWIRAFALRAVGRPSPAVKETYDKDLVVPINITEGLHALEDRGVRTLLMFSKADRSLDYFRKAFGKDLGGLAAFPRLTPVLLPLTAHLVTERDEDAITISGFFSDWIERSDWSAERGESDPEAIAITSS